MSETLMKIKNAVKTYEVAKNISILKKDAITPLETYLGDVLKDVLNELSSQNK